LSLERSRMKSPFPGMDPFMELRWPDLHNSLTTYIRDQLQDQLPQDLVAQMTERVVMEVRDDEEPEGPTVTIPDVRVAEHPGGVAVASRSAANRETANPDGRIYQEMGDPEKEIYIEIVDALTRGKVITVIELISPTNKLWGRDAYLAKRATYFEAKINLVEIDLTREGNRALLMPWSRKLPEPQPAYLACVHRLLGQKQPHIDYYLLPLELPLKPISIPLRPTDKDAVLDLQPLVELAYDRGRYAFTDYTAKLSPPLSYAEQAFLQQRLTTRA
jgi:hypothetical protein